MKSDFLEKLNFVCSDVKTNEKMSKHTTFRIGGEAEYYVRPSSKKEITDIIGLCNKENIEYMTIGNGSNLLVSDFGIDGVVIDISNKLSNIKISGNKIEAEAGVLLSKLAKAALAESLSGLEFAAGIPGTLGGGIYMNAGAYGGELKDVVKSVEYADENGEIRTAHGEELGFGYRKSMFTNKKMTILSCVAELEKGDYEIIKSKMEELNSKRAAKQPFSEASAGSTFKRPEGYFAGSLIEAAGLKGYSVGGAAVSEKHAGFVVNKGGASASDVKALIEYVQKTVSEKFSVELEPEVKIIGKNE